MTDAAAEVPATHSPAVSPLTPGQALAALFLANAHAGCNAANDVFVEELLRRRREIQRLGNPPGE